MDVVIQTTLVVEASWLPELADHLATMVPVEEILGEEADQKQACIVGLSTREEAAIIAVILHVALIRQHLKETVVARCVWHHSVG